MRSTLAGLGLLLFIVPVVEAHGIVIPQDRTIAPLAMVRHEVAVAIEDQAAVTKVEQTFRNHTAKDLEALYVFPIPRGAAVNGFSLSIDGKDVKGELLDAAQARSIYAETVRRTQDPALLEYLGNEVFRVQVLVRAASDLKLSLRFTAELPRESGIIEYVYPLKTDGRSTSTLEKFALSLHLKSQHGVQNIYSPTHAVAVNRSSDREVKVNFQEQQALLDKDFRLLFTHGHNDVGLTALMHRPDKDGRGHFMLLLSPRAELPKENIVPRDVVLVLDTSGSMAGASIQQAKKALKFVLERLGDQDRFALVNFDSIVNVYGGGGLRPCTPDAIAKAKRWVDGLVANGGTNINDALLAALDLNSKDPQRTFTIAFFTDGQPTVGEQNPAKIADNVQAKNTANTRIFTFGVGYDVNATLLDLLALRTRASSVYLRPTEDIEGRVAAFYNRISQPVMVNLRLTADSDVGLEEMYPPKLPDLFHGGQVMVLGRYTGHGKAKVTLHGTVGKEEKTFEYEVDFPEQTKNDRQLVEVIWARRKIGFLLDQVRSGGEQKELVDSIVALAKQHGIATPYTSYLIVPHAPLPVVGFGQPGSPSPSPSPAGAVNSPSPAPKSHGGGGGKFRKAPTRPASPPMNGAIQGGSSFGFQGGGFQGGGFQGGGLQGAGFQGGGFQGGGFQGGGFQGGGFQGAGFQGGSSIGSFGGGFQGGAQAGSANLGAAKGYLGGFQGGGFQGTGFQAGFSFQGGGFQGGGFQGGGFQGAFGNLGFSGGHGFQGQGVGMRVADWARHVQNQPGGLAANRGKVEDARPGLGGPADKVLDNAKKTKLAYDQARAALAQRQHGQTQSGQLGVDLSVESNRLRNQSRLALTPLRKAAGRTMIELDGAWIDEGYDAAMPTVAVKALSEAYFLLLERQPRLRELFQLGNFSVWVAPNGSALVIDLEDGQTELTPAAIDELFTAGKKS